MRMGPDARIADLLTCGYKIEKDRTNVGTTNCGFTEVLGGLLYKSRRVEIDERP